ncbi:hypothetical protein KY305_11215 [Bacillus sp. YC2]|uniref:hypothetical protein n=1 Tax=Bacillus sp. YC2 TaxID=2861287 RepID=UPI001CA6EF2C|nr:hypothetical protein [Bacillus sp. YC2]MBY8913309.1 hypothetical protein [Bacillus sp. YC2]
MGRQFYFQDLITEYAVLFTLTTPADEGHYDDLGRWVSGESAISVESGALIPLPTQLIYQSGGRLTSYDRQLYINKNIPLKSRIEYDGVTYDVESKIPYSDYADFDSYILKAVNGLA